MVSEQKGITLVALVITIIIMLILAGVAIYFALNGGIIDRANEAKFLTQREIDRETLLSEVAGAYNDAYGYMDFEKLDSRISAIEFEKVEDGIYESKSGNKFSVDSQSGLITYIEE